MGEIVKFPEGEDEDTVLVCCAECEGVTFIPLLYKNQLFLQCADEGCGEVYDLSEIEEASPYGLQ